MGGVLKMGNLSLSVVTSLSNSITTNFTNSFLVKGSLIDELILSILILSIT